MDRHPFTEEVDAGSAESLLASTIFLMSRHAATPCPKLARIVDRHLAALVAHPGCGPLVREICRRAAGDWAAACADCPLGFGQPPCEGRS